MSEYIVWNELGNLYFKIGAFDEAIAAYKKAIQLNRRSGWLYSNLALSYYRKGKYMASIPLYQKGIELLPGKVDKARLWNRLGDAYRRLNDFDNAMAAYQSADDLGVVPPSSGEKPDEEPHAFLDEDEETNLEQAGREASPPPTPAVRVDPPASSPAEAAVPTEDLADWLHQLEEDTAARRTNLLETKPPEWRPSVRILPPGTEASANEADPGKSRVEPFWVFDTNPLIAEPPDPEKRENRPSARPKAYAAPWTVQVESPLRQVVMQVEEPTSLSVSPIGMTAPAPSGGTVAVVQEFEREDQVAESEQKNDHISVYKRVTEVNPSNDRAWDSLGKAYKAAGFYDEAIAAFERAISIAPYREAYVYNLGLVYTAQNLYEKAVEAFKKVADINPSYILAHAALAGIYRRLGRDSEAMEHIQIALPGMEAENEYNRACFAAICGETDQAVQLLQVALEKDQTDLEWVRTDPDLDNIRQDARFKALLGEGTNHCRGELC